MFVKLGLTNLFRFKREGEVVVILGFRVHMLKSVVNSMRLPFLEAFRLREGRERF